MLSAVSALFAQAGEQSGEFDPAREYYTHAEFGNAASHFQVLCQTNNDEEACYMAGMSMNHLAWVCTFGCTVDAKAREYYSRSLERELAPGNSTYRDGLFEFPLNSIDCSRTALRQADGMLSAIQASDPDYRRMRSRLEDA